MWANHLQSQYDEKTRIMKLSIITINKPLRLRHEDIKCNIKNTKCRGRE